MQDIILNVKEKIKTLIKELSEDSEFTLDKKIETSVSAQAVEHFMKFVSILVHSYDDGLNYKIVINMDANWETCGPLR